MLDILPNRDHIATYKIVLQKFIKSMYSANLIIAIAHYIDSIEKSNNNIHTCKLKILDKTKTVLNSIIQM